MFNLKGKVIEGKKRGKTLGFPTANIKLDRKIPEGIYISKITFQNNTYPSLTFIGAAVTFGEAVVQAETHILNFEGELYDEEIEIELIIKIRDNMKFTSQSELVEQMKKDKKRALEYFNKNV